MWRSDSSFLRVGIIGGGPAGSACAIAILNQAQQQGIEVEATIYEPRDFSREPKACVGLLSPPIMELFQELKVDFPDHLIHLRLYDYTLHTERESVSFSVNPEEGEPSYALRRQDFDSYMLEQAAIRGGKIIRERVLDLQFRNDEVVLTSANHERAYQVVVGAFGLDEATLQLFERRIPTYRRPRTVNNIMWRIPASRHKIDQITCAIVHAFLLSEMKEVEFAALTPKKDYVVVNVAGEKVSEAILHQFLKIPTVKELIPSFEEEFCPLPQRGRFPTSPAKGIFSSRVVTVGDSSGLVRPFKGKGINSAIQTGMWAAESILSSRGGQPSFRRYYQRCAEIRQDYRYGQILRILVRLAKFRSSLDAVLQVAKKEPRLYQAFFNTLSGYQTYRQIVKSCLAPGLFFQLARAVIPYLLEGRSSTGRTFPDSLL